MNKTNELLETEKIFEVDKPMISGISAWPFLRQKFYFELIKKNHGFNSKLRSIASIQLFKNAIYGFHKLAGIGKYKYLFFNNADKRTFQINGRRYDVFFDTWADRFGQERSLFIEWAIKKHYPSRQTYSKNVISDIPFKLGSVIFAFFTSGKVSDEHCFRKIKEKYQIEFDIEKELKSKMGEVRFYRFLFKRIKPKAIFLISSFTKVSIVVAAHLESIDVVEVQHGFIGDNHQFYNAYHNFGPLYYPDKLLAFGRTEKTNPAEHFIFNADQIIPIGSFYLEHIKNEFESEELSSLKQSYTKVFCVALQTVKEKELLAWISELARNHDDWLFILKPRNYEYLDYSEYTERENINLYPNYSVYELLKYSDYCMTIYSTVAVEASMFDVKTLFYNIDGLSLKYFDTDKMFASVIDFPNGIIGEKELDRTARFEPYFVTGYNENVSKAVLF